MKGKQNENSTIRKTKIGPSYKMASYMAGSI